MLFPCCEMDEKSQLTIKEKNHHKIVILNLNEEKIRKKKRKNLTQFYGAI